MEQQELQLENNAITQAFLEPLEPLCKATTNLLRPINVQSNDYLEIDIDDEGKRFVLTFYALGKDWFTNEIGRVAPSWSIKRFIERIPERKEVFGDRGCRKYIASGTDFTALIIRNLWPSDRLIFVSKEATLLYQFLLARFLNQTEKAKIKANYKINHEVPDMPEDFIDHPIRPLMSFQKVAVLTGIDQEGDNLWMEQGTGKTPIIISKICYDAHRVYQKENRMYRALIVVPSSMRMNWHNKFMDFATHSGKLTVLRGCKLTRVKLLVEAFKSDPECEYTVVICSYDTVIKTWGGIRMVEWDYCCLDEAHMIKSDTTKRWKTFQKLREICKRRSGLTGTPIANSLFDVWTQLEWLGEGLSGFMSFKGFRAYYGKFCKSQDGQRDILEGYTNLPILQERFTRLCFMITVKEALPELPESTYDVYEVEMSKEQREFYKQLQTQLAIEIEAELKSNTNKQLTANNILTKLLRLSQITSGYLKWDAQVDTEGNVTQGDIQYLDKNPKLEALVEILKGKKETDKTIVWTNWIPALKLISERLTKEGIDHVTYYGGTSENARIEAERRYNQDPKCKVWLSNPAAGGVGLDLWGHIPEWVGTDKDHGCNTTQEIYYSQDWSMIKRSQSEKRGVRKGTRVSVQITDLLIPKTIDEEIACRVLDKKMTAMQLQDVRSIYQRIISNVSFIGDIDEQ